MEIVKNHNTMIILLAFVVAVLLFRIFMICLHREKYDLYSCIFISLITSIIFGVGFCFLFYEVPYETNSKKILLAGTLAESRYTIHSSPQKFSEDSPKTTFEEDNYISFIDKDGCTDAIKYDDNTKFVTKKGKENKIVYKQTIYHTPIGIFQKKQTTKITIYRTDECNELND